MLTWRVNIDGLPGDLRGHGVSIYKALAARREHDLSMVLGSAGSRDHGQAVDRE